MHNTDKNKQKERLCVSTKNHDGSENEICFDPGVVYKTTTCTKDDVCTTITIQEKIEDDSVSCCFNNCRLFENCNCNINIMEANCMKAELLPSALFRLLHTMWNCIAGSCRKRGISEEDEFEIADFGYNAPSTHHLSEATATKQLKKEEVSNRL